MKTAERRASPSTDASSDVPNPAQKVYEQYLKRKDELDARRQAAANNLIDRLHVEFRLTPDQTVTNISELITWHYVNGERVPHERFVLGVLGGVGIDPQNPLRAALISDVPSGAMPRVNTVDVEYLTMPIDPLFE